jgi:hypothetical protein
MAEKWYGETIKLGLYAKRNQSKPGQRVIDVIKEYGNLFR